jgi:hypothetical protein
MIPLSPFFRISIFLFPLPIYYCMKSTLSMKALRRLIKGVLISWYYYVIKFLFCIVLMTAIPFQILFHAVGYAL